MNTKEKKTWHNNTMAKYVGPTKQTVEVKNRSPDESCSAFVLINSRKRMHDVLYFK